MVNWVTVVAQLNRSYFFLENMIKIYTVFCKQLRSYVIDLCDMGFFYIVSLLFEYIKY